MFVFEYGPIKSTDTICHGISALLLAHRFTYKGSLSQKYCCLTVRSVSFQRVQGIDSSHSWYQLVVDVFIVHGDVIWLTTECAWQFFEFTGAVFDGEIELL